MVASIIHSCANNQVANGKVKGREISKITLKKQEYVIITHLCGKLPYFKAKLSFKIEA